MIILHLTSFTTKFPYKKVLNSISPPRFFFSELNLMGGAITVKMLLSASADVVAAVVKRH